MQETSRTQRLRSGREAANFLCRMPATSIDLTTDIKGGVHMTVLTAPETSSTRRMRFGGSRKGSPLTGCTAM